MNDGVILILIMLTISFVFILLQRYGENKTHFTAPKPSSRDTFLGSRQTIKQTSIDSRRKSEEELLYGKLLSMVLGDKGVAERLIEHEKRKLPTASRIELIQRAIDHKIGDGMR